MTSKHDFAIANASERGLLAPFYWKPRPVITRHDGDGQNSFELQQAIEFAEAGEWARLDYGDSRVQQMLFYLHRAKAHTSDVLLFNYLDQFGRYEYLDAIHETACQLFQWS